MSDLYVIEGGDGVGKSSVAREVAGRLGFQFFDTPTKEFAALREAAHRADLTTMALFYILTNRFFSELVGTSGTPIVSARYMDTSVVDYSVRMSLPLERFEELFSPLLSGIVEPRRTFLLTASPEIQRARINLRNQGINTHTDELVLSSDGYVEESQRRYQILAKRKGWDIIDTSHCSIEETADMIARLIGKRSN